MDDASRAAGAAAIPPRGADIHTHACLQRDRERKRERERQLGG